MKNLLINSNLSKIKNPEDVNFLFCHYSEEGERVVAGTNNGQFFVTNPTDVSMFSTTQLSQLKRAMNEDWFSNFVLINGNTIAVNKKNLIGFEYLVYPYHHLTELNLYFKNGESQEFDLPKFRKSDKNKLKDCIDLYSKKTHANDGAEMGK